MKNRPRTHENYIEVTPVLLVKPLGRDSWKGHLGREARISRLLDPSMV